MAIPAYLLQEAAMKAAPQAGRIMPFLSGIGRGISSIPSKIPLSFSIPAFFMGQEGLRQWGKAGERRIQREELDVQGELAKVQLLTQKKLTEESRREAKRLTKKQLEILREQAKEAREMESMRLFAESQERQTAMLLAALQISGNRPTGAPIQNPVGAINMMRTGVE